MKDMFNLKAKCFIAAEISANHGQNFKRAVALIKEAKHCGADAVKFQVYTPETLTINSKNKYFMVKHQKWGGQSLYQLYQKTYTPWKWFKALKRIAGEEGLTFFATAFDKTSVDFLEELGVCVHKIASFEIVDLPLIEYMAKTKKPIILSTGMAEFKEIIEAVSVAKRCGNNKIILLKCVSSYPAKPKQMNLITLQYMKKFFNLPVGLSDHTLSITVPIAAVCFGARFVEKHFTLSRRINTPDSFFSLEPQELKDVVSGIRTAEDAMGRISFKPTREEKKNKIFRRSLFVAEDIKKGQKFNEKNVRSIRPSNGLAPKYLRRILGKPATQTIKRGTPLFWKFIG